MCKCENIDYGTYANTVSIKLPWKDKIVDIDRCVLEEVQSLWEKGIRTIESCCGHNKNKGYIAVFPEYNHLMALIGYELEPDREGWENPGTIFYSKTL